MEGLSKLILQEKHDGISHLLFVEDVLFGIGYEEEWSAFLDIINLLCALPQACTSILKKYTFHWFETNRDILEQVQRLFPYTFQSIDCGFK